MVCACSHVANPFQFPSFLYTHLSLVFFTLVNFVQSLDIPLAPATVSPSERALF